MQITFLGVGSAFTTAAYYQSNMLITARSGRILLLDCGGDIRFSLGACGVTQPPDALYISHLHSDHVGGMEWLGMTTCFTPDASRPRLFMAGAFMEPLWSEALKAGMEYVEGRQMNIGDYFDCRPVAENGSFHWEGIRFELVKLPHVTAGNKAHPSYGVFIRDGSGPEILITTDTQFVPDRIRAAGRRADLIFHDCETSPVRSRVHAHYDDLRTLPPEIRRKTWLYHYQPRPAQHPRADGFRGFVVRGQRFEF
ncbi:MBL fold hydrolase [Desulfonema ishimotonii]|uniref:MBL fold hydrolase n=1 Tax=Desulfonema ishimotonii TaxID=45657 RepID=A0A401G2E9_9BACT|nr:MBL fold metallo-hydrolase [Desulfonema ishimotonii]GBC63397.1 MBL fold hydrolase [Desulfonema ishimotonii]